MYCFSYGSSRWLPLEEHGLWKPGWTSSNIVGVTTVVLDRGEKIENVPIFNVADPSEAQRKEDPQEIIELESPPQQMSPIWGASVADLPSRNRQYCETVEFGREVKAKPVEKHPMQPSACDGKCPLYGHIVALYGIYIIKVNRHLQKRIEHHHVHSNFWAIIASDQAKFVLHSCDRIIRKGGQNGRKFRFIYKFPMNEGSAQVCKGFFLTALGFKRKNVAFVFCILHDTPEDRLIPPEDTRGKSRPPSYIAREPIIEHINSFHPEDFTLPTSDTYPLTSQSGLCMATLHTSTPKWNSLTGYIAKSLQKKTFISLNWATNCAKPAMNIRNMSSSATTATLVILLYVLRGRHTKIDTQRLARCTTDMHKKIYQIEHFVFHPTCKR